MRGVTALCEGYRAAQLYPPRVAQRHALAVRHEAIAVTLDLVDPSLAGWRFCGSGWDAGVKWG